MAGLSIWHIILFAIVLILVFGTAKLKNLGKDLGGAVKDFKDSVKNDDVPALPHQPDIQRQQQDNQATPLTNNNQHING